MKQLFITIAIFLSLQSFGAFAITGQLMNEDSVRIGDNTSYVRLSVEFTKDGKSINVLTDVYKGKQSYVAGKKPLQDVIQINRVYSIDSATIADAPASGFANLPGKTIIDKFNIWVHWKVKDQILFLHPELQIEIVDIRQ